jgi:hypothetical protein
MMMKFVKFSNLLVLAMVSSACGTSDSADMVDAYIGSWKGCISAMTDSVSYFTNRTRTFRKVDATHMLMDVQSDNRYSDDECAIVTGIEQVTTKDNAVQLSKTIKFMGHTGHGGVLTITDGTETFYITVESRSLRIGSDVTVGVPTGWSYPYAKQI